MRLEGQRCIVRPWAMTDLPSLVNHANNRRIWRNLTDRFPNPYSEEQGREFLQHCAQTDSATQCFAAIELDGHAVGAVGFEFQKDVYSRTAEFGYWLGEPFWGRGIVTEALCMITAHAFETTPLIRAQACVYAWNPASGRVLEKAGYHYECRHEKAIFKDNTVTDALVYCKFRR